MPTGPIEPVQSPPPGYECRADVLRLPGPWPLHFGGRLEDVEVAYRLAGARDAPVVAVLGGISSGRAAMRRPARGTARSSRA